MDFSKFSDADFDAKEWVNSALRAHKDARVPIDVSDSLQKLHTRLRSARLPCYTVGSLLQAHASTLVMKLQLFIQVGTACDSDIRCVSAMSILFTGGE